MPTYADSDTVIETSGVSASDLPLDPEEGQSEEERFDDLVRRLNERASSLIDEFCQRDFEYHPDDTAVLDGNRRRKIRLSTATNGGPFYPVLGIQRIDVNDREVNPDHYRVNTNAGGSNSGIIERKAGVWPNGWENVEVSLDWGYEDPPAEIKAVAEELVTDALLGAMEDDTYQGASSISMDGFSVSFPERLPSEYEERLKRHRRIVTG